MSVGISAIEYHLAEKVIDNNFFEHAKNEFLEGKVGIKERRIARDDQATSDLAMGALTKLLENNNIDKNSIEFLLVCTMSPDYMLPQMSPMLQHRIGLPTNVYALDITLGCSGFVYTLSVAQALIKGLGFKRGVIVTADKFSRFLSYKDYTVDTLFSDSATAVLVEKNPKLFEIKNFDFGTDGSGEKHILVEAGGSRLPYSAETAKLTEVKPGVQQGKDYLYMNGRQVMKFSSSTVPVSAGKVLGEAKISMEDIDWVVLHQATRLCLKI
jgi:3-oxoacyl-[acyl-carrier-protein] synthase III